MQASGGSMLGAGIRSGDLLVVDRVLEAGNEGLVIAAVDGELTVKRLEKRPDRIRLLAENPAYPPIELKDGQDLTLWRVVASVIHHFRRRP